MSPLLAPHTPPALAQPLDAPVSAAPASKRNAWKAVRRAHIRRRRLQWRRALLAAAVLLVTSLLMYVFTAA